MKKLIMLIMVLCVVGCGNDDQGTGSSIIELQAKDSDVISSKTVTGEIAPLHDVDRYMVRLNEVGRNAVIKVTSDTYRPDVELLVNVFEMNADGDLVMVAGDHAPEDAQMGADIKITVYVDEPKVLYINVRDLMDDEPGVGQPYAISVYYEAPEDGNGSYDSAEDLVVDGDAARGAIGFNDDLDCFNIQVAHDGVYDVFVDFNRLEGSQVSLKLELFNNDGERLDLRTPGSASTTHMIHYLTAGTYYAVVSEDGKDEFDNSSFYEVSVSELAASEVFLNDTVGTATVTGSTTFSLDGSIDYYTDMDYYTITSTGTGNVQILNLTFESETSFEYLIELVNAADTDAKAFAHEYTGGDGPFVSQVKLPNGATWLLRIRASTPAALTGLSPYSIVGDVEGVVDLDEEDDGNDTEQTAREIEQNDPPRSGKIICSGDSDWYFAEFPYNETSKQLFSVWVNVPDSSNAQYAMRITGPGIVTDKVLYNFREEMRAVDLQTSLLVPPGIGNAKYFIKIFDYQNNDSDVNATFTVDWDVADVVTTTPANCPKDGGAAVYHNENDESDPDPEVTMWYPNYLSSIFNVDGGVLDIGTEGNYTTSTVDGNTVLQSRWIAGYMDYDGDEDWFSLDLTQPYVETDTAWYYQVNVEFYAEGSPVEYVLEVLPDSNNNAIVGNYTTCSSDAMDWEGGALAAWGDTDLGLNTLDWPGVGESGYFWIGRGEATTWYGPAYIRISDFNYIKTDAETYNPEPDNDWDQDTPYYFRVTLTYHSGVLEP